MIVNLDSNLVGVGFFPLCSLDVRGTLIPRETKASSYLNVERPAAAFEANLEKHYVKMISSAS